MNSAVNARVCKQSIFCFFALRMDTTTDLCILGHKFHNLLVVFIGQIPYMWSSYLFLALLLKTVYCID